MHAQALPIHREVRNRRLVGMELTGLAQMCAASVEGEAVLREGGDDVSLVPMVCVRGSVAAALGRQDAARAALAEAEAIARKVGMEPASAAGQAIAGVHALLAAESR